MNFIERKVRSAPGLSQEAALESLQSHPGFKAGTKIASLRRRGERWVAVLQVPKTAGDFGDEGSEVSKPKSEVPVEELDSDEPDGDEGPGDEDGPEGLPKPPGGDEKPGGKGEPGKGGTEEQILHVLTEILHALKGGPVGPELSGPDDLGPGPDALGGPPPGGHGLPPGGPPKPGAAGIGAKLRPGEVPNKPGVVPLGAQAFSSAPLYQRIAKVAGRQRHIPVSSPVGMTIKQAKAELDPIANHFGYKVAQVRYCGPTCSCQTPGSSQIHALLEAQ